MIEVDWNLARAFCMTADTGSLSAAARRLGLTQPTLSRQVAALEAALGVTLFERVGKKLVLTESGLSLLEHARAMSNSAEAMALAAVGRSQDIGGAVNISATDAVSAYLLPEIVEAIRQKAPQITIGIVASNTLSDIRRREADIAIRHVQPTEDELIGQLVGTAAANLYASKDWVARRGMPASIDDLLPEDLVGFEPVDQFAEHLKAIGISVNADRFRIVSENAVVLWEMVRRGLGVGMMLREVAERTPGLVRLLPQLPVVPVPVWLVTHRELRTSARVRLVFDVLGHELKRIVTVARDVGTSSFASRTAGERTPSEHAMADVSGSKATRSRPGRRRRRR
jgi:DNA-binding transcriptional LysR family regulator